MMEEVDSVLTELFGSDERSAEWQASLGLIANALSSLDVRALAVAEPDGQILAQWGQGPLDGDQLREQIQALLPIADDAPDLQLFDDSDATTRFLLRIEFPSFGPGLLAGLIDARLSVPEIKHELSELVPWLKVCGVLALTVCRSSIASAATESRLRQITRQFDVFREENLQTVAMNLEASEARLREERLYAERLEEEVAARTQELIVKEARIRAILEAAPDAIVSFDENGCIQSFNRAAEWIFGRTHDEVIGQSLALLLHDSSQNILENIDAMIAGISDGEEIMGRRRDGSTFPMHFALSEVPLGDRRFFTAIMQDITERKQAEEIIRFQNERLEEQVRQRTQELQKAKVAAEMANRAKSEFLANMSHELRTPLTAILGFSETLLSELGSQAPAVQIDAIDTVLRNGEHLVNVINSVLDLSKIEAGKLEIERIECSPFQLIEEVISLLRARAELQGITLDLTYLDRLPEVIFTDPTRLRQILLNIIGNSIKFTQQGGVHVKVSLLQSADCEPMLEFRIIDTGIGMTDAQMANAFEPFSQADSSTTRRFGGTGLGLPISLRLARILGGNIRTISEPGQGSTFRVTVSTGVLNDAKLIDRRAYSSTVNTKGQEGVPVEPSITKLNCRILLAEDGPDNQRLISFVLRKVGAEVAVVDNGQMAYIQAMEALDAGQPFDLIFMDMQMPVLDGYDAVRNLRDAGYDRPIVALTAHAMTGDRERCIQAGCNEYCTKPINRNRLIAVAAEYCNSQVREQQPQ